MVADIGIIIAVYVAFRAVEAMLHLGPGGRGADLSGTSRVVIAICALVTLAAAIVLGYDIIRAGTASEEIAESVWP